MLTRRRVLRGLSAAPIAAAVPAMPAERPAARADLDRYIAWLAHEHRAALMERYRMPADQVPIGWMPDTPDVREEVEQRPPSTRARQVLRMFFGS